MGGACLLAVDVRIWNDDMLHKLHKTLESPWSYKATSTVDECTHWCVGSQNALRFRGLERVFQESYLDLKVNIKCCPLGRSFSR